MNRKEKGWLAEAAVKAFYELAGYEVRNLAPAEPASDLLIVQRNTIVGEAEVKYGRQPGDLDREEKQGIWASAQRCHEVRRSYTLWCVIATLGERGRPVALTGHPYWITSLGPSAKRRGLSLSTYKGREVALPLPAMGQGGMGRALPPLNPSPKEAEG